MTPYLLVLAVLLGIAPGLIAHGKGRNFFIWWIYGVVLGPVALLHAILLRRHVVPSPFVASPPRQKRWRSYWPAVLWAATSVAIAIVAVTVYGLVSPQDFGLPPTGARIAQPVAELTGQAQQAQETQTAAPGPAEPAPAAREAPPTVRVTLRREPPPEEKLERAPVLPVERMVSGDSPAPGSTLERTTPRTPAPRDAEKTVAESTTPAEPAAPTPPTPASEPKIAAISPAVEAAARETPAEAPKTAEPQTARLQPAEPKPAESTPEPRAAAPKPAPTEVTAVGETVRIVQIALAKRGYDPGAANGRAGSKTQAAIRKFQSDRNLQTTGIIDYDLLEALGIVGPRVHAFRPPPGMTVGR